MRFRILAALLTLLPTLGLAADVVISPNMGLPVPVVGTAPSPEWANDINASLSIIDQHDHTPGHGVPVTPAGLSITSDLSFGGNNATTLRSTRYSAQSAPISGGSDLGALYVSGVDLYYNDENGNQVRITQGGSVTGSSGTITGLPSGTASAAFSASTFTFQSATSTPANLNVGPVTIGRNAASPKTVTLAPSVSQAANYNWTFPTALPGSTSLLTVDTSGNLATTTTPTITGGAFSGTITGSPTFSGTVTFSGSIVPAVISGNVQFGNTPVFTSSATIQNGVTVTGTGGNTPHSCTIRSSSGTTTATSTCSAGEIPVGGSCENSPGTLVNNHPTTTAWVCSQSGGGVSITAYAICCLL